MEFGLKETSLPAWPEVGGQPDIPSITYDARADDAYRLAGVDWLAVYADREHFGNIVFLTGFEPRFEEAFLLLGPRQQRLLLVGNESESYAAIVRLPSVAVLRCQSLSLMGQDRTQQPRLTDQLRAAGIRPGDSVGLVGWKYLESHEIEGTGPGHVFVPAAYLEAFRTVAGENIGDATHVLMHPESGLRATVDADQIAAFEWAAMRASRSVWHIVSGVAEGDTEFAAAARMGYAGNPLNVHTMFASAAPGEPLIGLRSPTARRLRLGDGVTTAVGMWGALSSRAGLVARSDDDFLAIAAAYFAGLVAWYEIADIGVTGGAIFSAVTDRLAQANLASALNPGHLTGHEEWMHSPVRPGSTERLRSGMPFQVDIIPTPMPAGAGLNCEDAVTFADASLRDELRIKHPECHARIESRRAFMRDELGVDVRPSILPMSDTPLCLPPFWLTPQRLLVRV